MPVISSQLPLFEQVGLYTTIGMASESPATKPVGEPIGWPFRQERFAASTGMTGRTGAIFCERANSFLGKGMVPKSQKRQTFVWQVTGSHELNEFLGGKSGRSSTGLSSGAHRL